MKTLIIYCIFTQIKNFVVTIFKRTPMVLLVSEVSDNLDVVGELEGRIDGEDHFGIVLNDILRQSKDRCSNLAAAADRVFRILQVLLICAVRLVDDIGVINGAKMDAVDQVENW